MTQMISQLFGGGGAGGPDPAILAAQKQQIDDANKRSAELTAQEDARKRAIAGRSAGRASLLGPAGEVGVTGDQLKTTLGG